MPIELTMPRLSDTMEYGTIIKWNVREGDKVTSGQVVADIETDKATMEMQAFDDGTLSRLLVNEGQQVPVGTVIAVLAAEGEDAAAAGRADPTSAAKDSAPTPPPGAAQRPAQKGAAAVTPNDAPPREAVELPDVREGSRQRISPVARRLADEHDIDLSALKGSGPGGRVIKRDVLEAIDAAAETTAAVVPAARSPISKPADAATPLATRVPLDSPADAADGPCLRAQIVPLSNMRQTIARRLVEAKSTIPHYQVTVTFNMDPLLELRSHLNEQLHPQHVKLSVNDFLVRCCALAMHEHPEFNASWGGDHIEISAEVNIGIAISLPAERGGGLVVATVRHADQKSLRVISHESRSLAEKARTRGLSIQEMSDSTFTISNLGMFGVDNFTAIINPPNSAILAVGAALQKPVVRDGQIVIGHEMAATLSLDHRVLDGAMAAEYLQTLRRFIESPATLLV